MNQYLFFLLPADERGAKTIKKKRTNMWPLARSNLRSEWYEKKIDWRNRYCISLKITIKIMNKKTMNMSLNLNLKTEINHNNHHEPYYHITNHQPMFDYRAALDRGPAIQPECVVPTVTVWQCEPVSPRTGKSASFSLPHSTPPR